MTNGYPERIDINVDHDFARAPIRAGRANGLPASGWAGSPGNPDAEDEPVLSTEKALWRLQSRIARAAREPGGLAANTLKTCLIDHANLDAAFQRVASNSGGKSPGVDGLTAPALASRWPRECARLADQLLRDDYRASPIRWVDIPKSSDPTRTRTLGIHTIHDRIVSVAVKQVVEPVLEPIFLDGSHGFRPGRSVPTAMGRALDALNGDPDAPIPYTHALRLDITSCFDSMDHQIILQSLSQALGDDSILPIVRALLEPGKTLTRRFQPRFQPWEWSWTRREIGVVQGAALSPLLCNLALHPLDLALEELARQTQRGVQCFRYADDLLVLARSLSLARRAARLVHATLNAQRLRARAKDGPPIVPTAQGFPWLGLMIQPRTRRWLGRGSFGVMVPTAKIHKAIDTLEEMTVPPSDRISAQAFNPERWLVSLNEQLRQWWQAYHLADNSAEVFRVLDEFAAERVGSLLRQVTGKRGGALRRAYWTRLARGFWTWEVGGTRLVKLSALPPHAPFPPIYQPPWEQFEFRPRQARLASRSVALGRDVVPAAGLEPPAGPSSNADAAPLPTSTPSPAAPNAPTPPAQGARTGPDKRQLK